MLCAVLMTTGARAAEPVEPIVVGPSPMVVLPPPVKRPINWEPFILTGAGVLMMGLGAAAIGGSLLWVGSEGLLKDPIVRVLPGPGGVVVAGQF
jgi:hypothetical protein